MTGTGQTDPGDPDSDREALEELLSVASHDLRTPIIAIRNLGLTMSQRWDTIDDAEKRRYVSIMSDQACVLLELVTDMVTRAHGRRRAASSGD